MNEKAGVGPRSLTVLLRHVPAFEALEQDNLDRIAQNASRDEVPRGTVPIHQGDSADTLYIVLLAGVTPIAEISVGEPIGELEFFAGGTRTVNVVAARNREMLRLNRETYDALQRDVPELANGILASVAARLARTTGASPKL